MGWGSGVAVGCGVGRRHGLDPMLLWPWCRPAAVAPIQPIAWELPHTACAALKSKKKKKFKTVHRYFKTTGLKHTSSLIYKSYHLYPTTEVLSFFSICKYNRHRLVTAVQNETLSVRISEKRKTIMWYRRAT